MTFALSLVDSEIIIAYSSPVPAEIQGCSLWSRSMMLGCSNSEDPRLIAAKLYYNFNLCDHNTLMSWSDGTRAGWNENADRQVGLLRQIDLHE